jgi:hypothetical protein
VYDRAWSSLYLYMVVVTDMLKLTSTLAMELETNIKSSSILPLDSSESKRSAALPLESSEGEAETWNEKFLFWK